MKKSKNIIRAIIYLACIAVISVMAKLFKLEDSFISYIKGTTFDLSVLFRLCAMVLFVLAIEKIIRFGLSFIKIDNQRAVTVSTVLNSVIRYVAAIVIICWGLTIIGVDVATVAASVGIITLVIGFGAESLIEDAITGVFMLFENQYNVGDIVEVSGFRGTVTEIGIRTTSIKDASNNVKIINNSQMKSVLNRSHNISMAVSDIGIPYSVDLETFEKCIPEITKKMFDEHRDLFMEEPAYLGVQELASSAVVLRFVVACSEENIFGAKRALNHDLLILFAKKGVNCPYPQMDVHNV